MKYLKLFNESDSSDYYEEVGFSDYDKLKKLRISQSLVKKIGSKLKFGWYCAKNPYVGTYLNINFQYKNAAKKFVRESYTIRISSDEWFWVDVDNSLGRRKDMKDHVYYKCDQEEGLMRLLGDLGLLIE